MSWKMQGYEKGSSKDGKQGGPLAIRGREEQQGGPPHKKTKKGKADDLVEGKHVARRAKDEIKELMILVSKISLQNAQALRDLSSINLETFLAKSDLESVKRGKEAGQHYSEIVKNNKEHTMGPPFIHILLASLPALASDEKVGAKHREKIKEYLKFSDSANLETMCDHVKLFRISKTYRSDRVKIQFAFGGKIVVYKEEEQQAAAATSDAMAVEPPDLESLVKSIIMAMKSVGMERKQGRAPAGELERLISKGLNMLDEEL